MPKRKKKRKKRGYVRPSRAQPRTGWTLRDIERLTGIAGRTVRMYTQRGLLPAPPFKGRATRYERRQLLWLLAIRRLRTTERLSLTAIKTRLHRMSAPALEAFAIAQLAPGALAEALSVAPSSTAAAPAPAAGKRATLPAAGITSAGASEQLLARWTRFDLAIGLELNVREDASPAVLELARRVREFCRGNPG